MNHDKVREAIQFLEGFPADQLAAPHHCTETLPNNGVVFCPVITMARHFGYRGEEDNASKARAFLASQVFEFGGPSFPSSLVWAYDRGTSKSKEAGKSRVLAEMRGWAYEARSSGS